ncbi:MAG: phosphoribosylglycinamide formyltransferase [Eubacteriales Family XIII. Incertae Sedis bacterium]|nr:MAG: phosphoribosylglycinamide formyltransferase [Clostridiales Family XIII bacterium]
MLKTKIAVLISGGGTNLQAIIDFAKSGGLKSGELALVVSDKAGAYGLTRAEKASIPTLVIAADKSLEITARKAKFEAELQSALEAAGIEMIVLAGFMRILSADFVSKWENRIINVHPSLIPSFCGEGFYGLKVHEAALAYGVKVTGATVHFVNEVPDGGSIIYQKAVEIKDGDTAETLQRRVMEEAEWKLLPAACEYVANLIMERKI